MPTPDPNEKMENLLRAYAKKRREEGGAPFELSPDVRARLHDEVRRTLGPSAPKPRQGWSLWPARWHWLAPLGGVAAVVTVLLLVKGPPPEQPARTPVAAAKNPVPTEVAAAASPSPASPPTLRKLESVPLAAPAVPPLATAAVTAPAPAAAPALEQGPVKMTNHLLADEPAQLFDDVQRAPASDQKKVLAREETTLASTAPTGPAQTRAVTENLQSDAVAAANPLDVLTTTNTLAATSVATPSASGGGGFGGGGVGGGGGGGGGRQAGRGGRAGAGGGRQRTPTANQDASAAVGGLAASAAPAPAPAYAAPKTDLAAARPATIATPNSNINAPSSPIAGVLTSFQIERTGSKVRIVDGDGSVYEGQVSQLAAVRKLDNQATYAMAKDSAVQSAVSNLAQNQTAVANAAGAGNIIDNNGNVNGANFYNRGELPPGYGNNLAQGNQIQTANAFSSKPGGPPPPGAGTTFDFQVSGTNRNLKQIVTIVGTCAIAPLAQNLSYFGKAQANDSSPAPKVPPASQSQNIIGNGFNQLRTQNAATPVQLWHVTGQVQVGTSNRFDLDAATILR